MWSTVALCLLVGLSYVSSSSPAWKDNTEYVYSVNGRTLTGLEETADQYSGVFLKAKLHLSIRPDGKLQGRISEPKFAQIHTQLPDGWKSEIPDSQISYKQLQLSQKPFQLVLENGLIKRLIVEKDTLNWEANIIKSIVSQFQMDLQGENALQNPTSSFPTNEYMDAVFKTMEETVTGKTETIYDIHRLPEYLVQSQPWIAPQYKLKGEGDLIEVIKSKNYTNARDRPSYHYGFGEIEESEPTANKMGQFFIRQSNSRAILTGKPSRYIIQSTYTVNKIMVNPILKNKEMGSITSMVNVTLLAINNQQQQPEELSNPLDIGNLVYTYGQPKNNQVHSKLNENLMEDSSSEESSEQEMTHRRFRRSANSLTKQWRESSEEWNQQQQQPRPQLTRAPHSPLLPSMVGYHGKSIKENKDFDIRQNVENLVTEISDEIKQSEKTISKHTLDKYTILNTLVRLMDEDDIQFVAEQMYSQMKNGQQRYTWSIFRDSVAEAGTGPALLNIKKWIETKKIQKTEAAQVIGTLAQSTRFPTEEYMRKFFELATETQVRQQETLNQTCILSYTNLVHKVYINRNESHNQFPVHAFGSFYTKKGREFVKTTVIPHLKQELEKAISNADNNKIHVMIRALGNIGHKSILNVFQPYFEGEKQVSQFQRLMMVACMDRLADCYPHIARSVFYKIYQNTAELPEIRVVAVHQLIRANPPVEMLQRMAQYTNTDSQEEVNAAVKSVIESSCKLESSKHAELRKAAQSARPLLTKKQYGMEQSYINLRDYVAEQMGLELHVQRTSHSSAESSFPKIMKFQLHQHNHGMKQHILSTGGMISSIRELLNVLYRQTEVFQQEKSQRSQEQGKDNEWSSANIARLMNYERDEREQLEAIIYAQVEDVQKLWSFDNQTLEHLPEVIRQQEEIYRQGKDFSYVKLKQLNEMALSFPTEMGLPFLYTYDVPVLMKVEGKIRALANPAISRNNKLSKPEQISTEIKARVTCTGKTQSHLSFVTPFDHQIYMAGYDKNMYVSIPVNARLEMDVKSKEAKIEFEVEQQQQDSRLVHITSTPYTSRSDVMAISPVALRPNTYVIKSHRNNHRYFDFNFGKKETGLTFRGWGHHPEQSIGFNDLVSMWQSRGVAGVWEQLWDKCSTEYSEATISFIPSQSTTRKATFRINVDQKYQKQPETQSPEDLLTLNQLSSKLQKDEPKQRQQEIKKHVGSGINSALLSCSDISLEFEGDKKYEHVVGFAVAKSNADPKSRVMFYYKNKNENKQGALEIRSEIPNTNGLNLDDSLDTEPSTKYNMRLQYGNSENDAFEISAQAQLSRSQERKQYLINQDPLYHVCKEQMQQKNFQLPACQNMTIKANFLDHIKYQVQYQKLNWKLVETLEGMFKGLRVLYYPMTEIKSISSVGQNVVEGEVQFQPEDFRQVNVTVRNTDEETVFFNISLNNELLRTLLVPHPVFHAKCRFAGLMQGQQNYRPTCVIDQTTAQTFSNKTYSVNLDKEPTVVMQYVPKDARVNGQQSKSVEQLLRESIENYVVLVRQVAANQKEVIINLNHPRTQGKTVKIEMKPSEDRQKSARNPAAKVTIDGQEMHFDDKQIADKCDGYVQVYALPNGEVKLEVEDAFYLIYDGQRVKVTATGNKLRDSVYGLCGRFSQDKHEDFTVPSNCVTRDTRKFVESYQVEKGQQWRNSPSEQCIKKVLPLYTNVISNQNGSQMRTKLASGTVMKHRYIEENGEICFTIRPLPVCNTSVKQVVTKNVPVHCIQGTKTAYYYKSLIDQGGNPDFSRKSETRTARMEVAAQCN
ncbi:vitellogenin [Anthonomus grandis grandis]|uniref:vitellogenin n=1 Tax=Anthonomus grandis grandis TaxID=2921223 RepID=UPI0021652144|nr:vitellogenin [Anthonomus grandis grandis]